MCEDEQVTLEIFEAFRERKRQTGIEITAGLKINRRV